MPELDVSFIHLTDLHVGMGAQKWLWPTVKHAVLDDLARIVDKTSSIDLVIFSGDLVQKGAKIEFDKLDDILGEIWSRLKSSGCTPLLFHVPGNHDLARPAARDPNFLNIGRWWEDAEVREDFWKNEFNYFDKLVNLFADYTEWTARLSKGAGVPLLSGNKGIFPGDQSAIFSKGGKNLGLVGMNSTWLQFAEGDLRGKLAVEVRQLHAITEGDPKKWCNANTANILVTHQPVSWLHASNAAVWESEINPPGRFDAHIYGHMHEPNASSISTFGSLHRVSMQGPSLFGLEYLADGETKRIHGYSLVNLSDQNGRRSLRVWPRVLHRIGSGINKIIPNHDFDLEDEGFLASDHHISGLQLLAPSTASSILSENVATEEAVEAPETSPAGETPISVLKYHLAQDPAHEAVRKLDQHRAEKILSRDRLCWIVSEWGMAADEFISSVMKQVGKSQILTFRLSVPNFRDKDQFSNTLKEMYGFSLERLIDQLAETSDCILIFDDVSAGELPPPGEMNTEAKIESICKIIIEYCQNILVVLRSRLPPVRTRAGFVQLREFDAVDLRGYIGSKKGEFSELLIVNNLQTLLRHTDGVPVRLDAALEQLEVVPLSELINTNSDLISEAGVHGALEGSTVLSGILQQLKSSESLTSQRSFDLLKVLSIFPRGEQLARIARFRGAHAFYPQNATELLKLSLIEASTTQLVELGRVGETSKVLLAPRLVRERVRGMMNDSEYQSMNRRAAELYFGSEWESGIFKPPITYRFDNPHCGSSEIQNANAIAIRLLKDARDFGGDREISAALGLAQSYSRALMRGDHFGNNAVFLSDFCSIVPEIGHEKKATILRSLHARSLRMIGERERARDILADLDLDHFDNDGKQTVLVSLLLCYKALDDEDGVRATGEKILAIDRNTPSAWQAKGVLLEMQSDSPDRTRKLRTLANFCRKNDAPVVADEISLQLARESKDNPDERTRLLGDVIKSTSEKKRFYTYLRANLQLADLAMASNGRLDEEEQAKTIVSYHYLFNEGLSTLFDRCHDLLWQDFETKIDIVNIVRLFRHSSLSWRLQGRDDKEIKYLKRARGILSDSQLLRKVVGSREFAYYESRTTTLAG